MADPGNILIIRLSSLGDVLMSVPAVQAIRRRFPGAHISWLVEGAVAGILARQDFIDEVILFPRSTLVRHLKGGHLPTTTYVLADFLKKLREREYDLIIDLHGIAKSVALMLLARGKKRIGFGRTFAKDFSHLFYNDRVDGPEKRIHKVERNMLVARHLGYENGIPDEPLAVHESSKEYIDEFFRSREIHPPVFAVNPFASRDSAFKRWPLDRYADLIGRIEKELGGISIIIWGPGEREEAQRLATLAGNSAQLACQTDIAQLYALLTRVNAYIGGDTGTTHIASAAGIPTLSIFGPTDVIINRPYLKNSVIVRKDIQCSPCKNKTCKARQCLMEISVDEVFEALKNIHKKDEA